MSFYRPQHSSNWLKAFKVIILILALYLTAMILKPIFNLFFAITFSLVKGITFIIVSILVLHFFLKLLFGYDLIMKITGGRFWRF